MLTLRKIAAVVAGLSLLLMGLTSHAATLAIGDAYYVGSVNDGIPADPTSEVAYINALILLAAGQGDTACAGTEICNRVGSTVGGLVAATETGALKFEQGGGVDITGSFQYIIGKYDASKAGTLVWFNAAGFTGEWFLPSTYNGKGLSHIGLYNPGGGGGGGDPLPEPGTLALLGLGLMGLGFSRRHRS